MGATNSRSSPSFHSSGEEGLAGTTGFKGRMSAVDLHFEAGGELVTRGQRIQQGA